MTFEVIKVMWQRQLKRYWRSKARIIGSLGQPILFLVALGFGLGPIYQKAGSGNYLEFLGPGVIAMSILFTSMFNGIEVIWDRQFGFLKETLVAPISRIKIMIGRTLGGATVATIQGIAVLLIALVVGFRPKSLMYLPLSIVFMFAIAMLYTSLGTAIASKLKDMHGFQLIMNFLIMPSFFLSGAIFPIDNLPLGIRIISYLNPLTYGVEALRLSFQGVMNASLIVDSAVLVSVVIVIGLIGGFLFSRIEL